MRSEFEILLKSQSLANALNSKYTKKEMDRFTGKAVANSDRMMMLAACALALGWVLKNKESDAMFPEVVRILTE